MPRITLSQVLLKRGLLLCLRVLDTVVYTSKTILGQLKMSSHAHLFQFISSGPALGNAVYNLGLFTLKTVKFNSARTKNNKLYHIWPKLKKLWSNESTTVF